MIRYPMPQPAPALAVHRLGPDDAAQIAALYRAAGRDGAWCAQEHTVRALFEMGAAWWGGFADGELVLCAASAASVADTPQAAALRGALACGIGNPAPERFLLPPAASRRGEVLAGPLLLLLTEQLFSFAAAAPRQGDAEPSLLAALPVKAPAPVLAAYFAAGFAAVRMRPLVSLRPHYLLRWHGAPGKEIKNGILQEETTKDASQANTKTSTPSSKQEPDALRRVYLPLADTLVVSRLLEQGFCATALCRSSADERTLIRLERGNG